MRDGDPAVVAVVDARRDLEIEHGRLAHLVEHERADAGAPRDRTDLVESGVDRRLAAEPLGVDVERHRLRPLRIALFDHGQDVFDPSLRIPLLVAVPGAPAGTHSAALASTLDLVPTVLDAVKVSYPPDLAGTSLLPAMRGQPLAGRERLFARNDRNLSASFDARHKVVATPTDADLRFELFDRGADPGERRAVRSGDEVRVWRRELELFLDRAEREWTHTRGLLGDKRGEEPMTPQACAQLRALGYVVAGCR